ncbi:MAG TPA: substrate-binding domain-containing protein, partial [Chitinophagaceae bacterium]|nr:substrate-binding domain-containing protein [Chitinophagaceae bacterium]
MKRELSFHDNIEFVYKNADGSSEVQIRQIEELVNEHIDLLIVSPNEVKPLSPIIQKVYDSGIPVVVVDRRIDSKKYTAFIGASNFEVGQNAGRYAVSLLKAKGNIMEITGIPDASPVIDRHDGFMDIISKYPDLKYVKKIENYTTGNDTENQLKQYLQANNNIDLIYAQNDFMAFDAYNICRQLGIEKKIKIIGIDGLPLKGDGLDMVENKYISASVLYPTGGQEAIATAVNILEHKPFSKENQLFTTIIDSSNIRIIKLQNEKVLAQQIDIDRSQQKIDEQKIITSNQASIIYTISISLALALILGCILFYYLRENRKINARLSLQNEEIFNQRNQLIELGNKAKEATEAKINFFTNISHEFRTPLTLILGPLEEMMSNPKLHYTTKQYLGLIQKNTIRLLKLVNELIDFRKIEVNKMQLHATENDLIAFINEITVTFAAIAKKRNIDLRVITKERSLPVWFDNSMLDKVLFNLLSNAFKFTSDNGFIHITAEKDNANQTAVIKVEDNGIGMSPDMAEHAFELFYQANITNQQGSGLGLSLSKELIRLHHGNIKVTSQQWKGASFEIILPLGTSHLQPGEMVKEKSAQEFVLYQDERIFSVESNENGNGHEAEDKKPNGSNRDRSVLVIEDNPDLRNFLVEKLCRSYQVLTADNGITALQQAFDNIPDLIITDIIIPGKDGITVTNTLKTDFRTSHIPVIMLTAKIEMHEQIEGMKNMADAYIVKPFNLQLLEETIRSVMRNRDIVKEHYTSE